MFDAVIAGCTNSSLHQLHQRHCSPSRLVALDAGAALHNVLEHSQFLGMVTTACAEMTLGSRFILGDGLGSEARARVIRLMLIEVFLCCFTWGGLRQRPPWHALLARGVSCMLGGVTAGTDGGGRARFVNKSAATTSTITTVAKGILGGLSQLRLALGVVLGAWVLLQVVWLHPWFSADFGCAGALLPVQIGLDGIVKEESIFVEIVLGLLLCHPLGL